MTPARSTRTIRAVTPREGLAAPLHPLQAPMLRPVILLSVCHVTRSSCLLPTAHSTRLTGDENSDDGSDSEGEEDAAELAAPGPACTVPG